MTATGNKAAEGGRKRSPQDPEKLRAAARRYYAKHREKILKLATENRSASRKYVLTICATCGTEQKRRGDMLKNWGGDCRRCSTKKVAARPEMKEIQRENGRRTPPPRENVVNYRRGSDNNLWRGGITPENNRVRHSIEMKEWRKAVFARDRYTCRCCGQVSGSIQADHIAPFALHPELRFEVSNGRTLCKSCHGEYGVKVFGGKIVRPSGVNPTAWVIWQGY